MLSSKDVAMVYETLLSSPGMNDGVKIAVTMTRKNALLLSKVIEAGLNSKDENALLLQAGNTKEITTDIRSFCDELLSKSGLVEMNDKLNHLQSKS